MRRQLIIFSLCGVAFVFAGGCGNQNAKQWGKEWDPNSIWDGNAPKGGAIPDFFQVNPARFLNQWSAFGRRRYQMFYGISSLNRMVRC